MAKKSIPHTVYSYDGVNCEHLYTGDLVYVKRHVPYCPILHKHVATVECMYTSSFDAKTYVVLTWPTLTKQRFCCTTDDIYPRFNISRKEDI